MGRPTNPCPSSSRRIASHPAVHHVRRGDHVGARSSVRKRLPGEQLQRRVVVHLAVAHQAAVAVIRVLAEADVGDHEQLRHRFLERPRRPLHHPFVGPALGALGVLALRQPEEQHAGDSEVPHLAALLHDGVHAHLVIARHRGDLAPDARARTHEQRVHQAVGRKPRLPHKPPQRLAAPQPSRPLLGERHHPPPLRCQYSTVAATSPAAEASHASAATSMPSRRTVSVVRGPIVTARSADARPSRPASRRISTR